MIDVTTSVFRQMARVLSTRALLYTEMVAAEAVVRGKNYLIDFKEEELPLVLQLGGNNETALAKAAKIGQKRGFSAINLNAGCPSDKVRQGSFGVILLHDLNKLSSLVSALQDAVTIPVSVKTRIGVDDKDSFDFTVDLVGRICQTGCNEIILHARKAWLKGLSPKENRTIPPLDYDRVYALKKMFPKLNITINGGINTITECTEHLKKVDGVMLGRAVINDPYLLALVDTEIYGTCSRVKSRVEFLDDFAKLALTLQKEGVALHHLYRHLLGFFSSIKGARFFRRYLSEHMTDPTAGPELLYEAARMIDKTA